MLFNSFQYLFFYVSILALSWVLANRREMRLLVLLLASFYFYFSNNGIMIFLLIFCMQIDYFAALAIEKATSVKRRKAILAISMASNLSILAFFKYFNFFGSSFNSIVVTLGLHINWVFWDIALPVGISFYTFESMSYTIDVYRGKIRAERRWSRFALFVSYFPHLIAGPILRPGDFISQMDLRPKLSREKFERGMFLIMKGLVKKIVLADFFCTLADPFFAGEMREAGWLSAWFMAFAFSFQIYFDFSGYTDVAIGCAKLMGFDFPENFRRPYVSQSITDFWRRWHVSLSSWLRDYLYIPLGGSRGQTRLKTYRNLMVTMLLGGLWHGAAWHFVLWGFFQGALLTMEKMLGWERVHYTKEHFLRSLIRSARVFVIVAVGWVIFRSENFNDIGEVLAAMVRFNKGSQFNTQMIIGSLVMLLAWLWQNASEVYTIEDLFLSIAAPIRAWAYSMCVVLIAVTGSPVARPFIYFKF